jgi:hypothetical protein
VKAGQSLLDHRIAHHVTDDLDFEPTADALYAFIAQESFEVKAAHAALSQIIAKPDVFYQGKLELRSRSFFGRESWEKCYAVLDGPLEKPRMIHFFKRYSAASPPFASYIIEDCMCTLEECSECKTDYYCFTLKAFKANAGGTSGAVLAASSSSSTLLGGGGGSQRHLLGSSSSSSIGGSIRNLLSGNSTPREVALTLCADHSKRQEGWLQALMDAGIKFEKDEEGDDVAIAKSIFQFSARKLNSQEIVPLSIYQGKVCLVVNVASK